MAELRLTGEVSELRRRFKAGYKLERTGGGHVRIRDKQDRLVEYQGRVLQFSLNPSPSTMPLIEHQLTETGVLKGPRRKPRALTAEQSELRRERLREAGLASSRERQQASEALHQRLDKIVAKVGGYDTPGIVSDLGRVGFVVARDAGLTRRTGEPFTPDLLTASAFRVARRQPVDTAYITVWNALAERIERAPDVTGEWYSMVRDARGLPADRVEVRPVGDDEWPFRVELLSLKTLLVDPSYQRPPNWPFVRKEASRFDPALVGTIDVAQRSPSKYAILDGQQRAEICTLVGLETIWASIYRGLDAASEARFFLHKNRDRKNVHPYYTFRARVASQDDVAMAIERIVEEHGYKVALGSPGGRIDPKTQDNIQAVHALEVAYKRQLPGDGGDCLSPVLSTLARSTRGRPHGQASSLIRGLSLLYSTAGDAIEEGVMVATIDLLGPDKIIARARDHRVGTGDTLDMAMAKMIGDEYDRQGRARGTRVAKLRPRITRAAA